MQKVPVTPNGRQILENQLREFKEERSKVIEAIAEARQQGDLSENAEYQYAKERQSFVEGKIIELEEKLANLQIIDPASLKGTREVKFGATVTIKKIEYDKRKKTKEFTYKIVGEVETEPKDGKISYKSPLARALLGKKKGDEVYVDKANGECDEYEILRVSYSS